MADADMTNVRRTETLKRTTTVDSDALWANSSARYERSADNREVLGSNPSWPTQRVDELSSLKHRPPQPFRIFIKYDH